VIQSSISNLRAVRQDSEKELYEINHPREKKKKEFKKGDN